MLFFEFGGDPPIAIAGMSLGKFVQVFDQCLILLHSEGLVLLRASRLSECPASPPFTHAQFTLDVSNGIAALTRR